MQEPQVPTNPHSPGHLRRLEKEGGVNGLTEALSSRLAPTDLQSLLLDVFRTRTQELSSSEVLKRYQQSRFCQSSPIPIADILAVKLEAARCLADSFDFLHLSPLTALGTSSVLATCDQNKIVSTIRNLEVSSDPTNVLALEAASRRRQKDEVHLGALQQVVRAQKFEAPLVAHFHLLGLLSTGNKGRAFLDLHISGLIKLLSTKSIGQISVRLTPLDRRGEAALKDLKALEEEHPGVQFLVDNERQSGRGYYQKLCFKIFVDGLELGDGGYTDWTGKLLSNRKEWCFISGIGLDRLAIL